MIKKTLDYVFGGGKRFAAMITVTLIYILAIPKDGVTFACYVGFVGAWAKFETDRKGE